jgi:hypothetical protein
MLVFGGAFFKKLLRVWGAEPHGHGISFLQSFFLCAFCLKEKSVCGEGAAANVGAYSA